MINILEKNTTEFKEKTKTPLSDLIDAINEVNTRSYKLSTRDNIRIQPLEDLIKSKDYQFKYFCTVTHWYKMTDEEKLFFNNRRRNYTIRSVTKSGIAIMNFNELHLNPKCKNYLGYHYHYLIEEIPSKSWLNPSNTMKAFMNKVDPELIAKCKSGYIPNQNEQISFMKKVTRKLNNTCPNGDDGIDIRPIYSIKGLLSYCTKQNKDNVPHKYVIDSGNSSGMDGQFIKEYHAQIRKSTKRLYSGQT